MTVDTVNNNNNKKKINGFHKSPFNYNINVSLFFFSFHDSSVKQAMIYLRTGNDDAL
jgi:hypothetical protein